MSNNVLTEQLVFDSEKSYRNYIQKESQMKQKQKSKPSIQIKGLIGRDQTNYDYVTFKTNIQAKKPNSRLRSSSNPNRRQALSKIHRRKRKNSSKMDSSFLQDKLREGSIIYQQNQSSNMRDYDSTIINEVDYDNEVNTKKTNFFFEKNFYTKNKSRGLQIQRVVQVNKYNLFSDLDELYNDYKTSNYPQLMNINLTGSQELQIILYFVENLRPEKGINLNQKGKMDLKLKLKLIEFMSEKMSSTLDNKQSKISFFANKIKNLTVDVIFNSDK